MRSEELMRMLHQLVGMTRRNPKDFPPPPPPDFSGNNPPPPPPPGMQCRERGRILILLEKENGVSQRRLAELLEIRPQSLSELLTKLENDGMIERKPNEDDKREILVSLSEGGKKNIAAIKEERERFAGEFFAPLTEEEQETLFALLSKLVEAKK